MPSCWQLVSSSRLLVMPSLAEGLGMPILEAWALGTPAIASSTTSLGEIINDPEWTFDPLDTAAQSQLLHTLLTDDSALRRCIDFAGRRGPFFTWDVVAQRAVTHITDHAGAIAARTHGGASPRQRATVVVAAPEGDITNRAESVLAALRASYDCTVTGASWQGEDGDLAIDSKSSDAERSERLIFLMDDVRQAPNIARALESLAPAVVVAVLPTDGSRGLSTSPGIKDARYLYESHGFRNGQPSTWDYLMPLAARCLGVLVVPGTPEPMRPLRQRSGRVVGVQDADHLTPAIEEFHACLPPKPPAGLTPLTRSDCGREESPVPTRARIPRHHGLEDLAVPFWDPAGHLGAGSQSRGPLRHTHLPGVQVPRLPCDRQRRAWASWSRIGPISEIWATSRAGSSRRRETPCS